MSVPGTKLPMSATMPLSGIIRTWRRRPNSLENDPNRTSLYLSESNFRPRIYLVKEQTLVCP
jgi:hypothetical protein